MKDIIVHTTVYEFSELSESAKQRAKSELAASNFREEDFCTMVREDLDRDFPASEDLKFQFSFAGVQGDGFNIYGVLNGFDWIAFLVNHTLLSTKEEELFNAYLVWNLNIEFKRNKDYTYSMKNQSRNDIEDTVEDWINRLEQNGVENIDEQLIRWVINRAYIHFSDLDNNWNYNGWNYFHNISNAEAEELSAEYDIWFNLDGTIA